jgi:hypothetical protein
MEYKYSFTKDRLKYLNKLHEFIKDIPELPSDFYLLNEDQVSVVFKEELNDSQIEILTMSIENYDPPQVITEVIGSNSIFISNSVITTTEYNIVGIDIWQADYDNDNDVHIGYITIASALIGDGDYSIRIYDTINNKVIGEICNLNNKNMSIITINNLVNIPASDTLIEVQAKVLNPLSKCIIKACQFVYTRYI